MAPLTLTPDELLALTGYRQPARQLEELRRMGFYRARRSVLGGVVLERAHYDSICAGREAQTPANQPQLRPPRMRSAA